MRKYNDYDLMENEGFTVELSYKLSIMDFLNMAGTAAINGSILEWWRILRLVYRRIYPQILQDGLTAEEKQFIELFNKSKKIFSANTNVRDAEIKAELLKYSLHSSEEILDDIEIKLWRLLFSFNWIFKETKKRDPNRAISEGLFHND